MKNFQIVNFLVHNGADVNAQTKYGHTALDLAIEHQDLQLIKFLVDNGADVNNAQTFYATALHRAAMVQDFEMIKLLVDNGADVNAQTEHGTALQEAVKRPDLEIVKFLIDNGADVNAQTERDTTLQRAIACHHFQITTFLVEHGADVNGQSRLYGTALQEAVNGQDLEIVKFLVDNGADVGLKGRFQRTALHYAAEYESPITIATVKLLLDKNACPNARDGADKTPFDVAIEAKNREIILLLLPRMKPVPALSAKCWRSALHLGPESFHRFTFGQHPSIEEITKPRGGMEREAIQDLFDREYYLSKLSTPEDVAHVVLSSEMWKINSSSMFQCQWWRCRSSDRFVLWSLQSSPLPSLDLCRQLEREDFCIECWFTIPCLTLTDNNWPAPQVSMPEKYNLLERTEGFYWVTTRWPSENSIGDSSVEELLRPVFSVTTCEDSPVEIVQSIVGLLIPLIDKLDRTFEDNTHQANSRLSNSRREVLRNGGSNEGLIQNLLSDATVIEHMTGNYGRIVRSLTELIDRVNSLQKGPWTLSDKPLQDSREKVDNLKRHREGLRELLEKSQGIIQLEFNLASIMEARKSTSTNRSLKRLTWVTFVFLPLLFVASLFGMNVDILSDDPSWWWYFPVAGGFTLVTFVVWIFFKRFRTVSYPKI
ncbi:ankyrin repeat-containing domain protein [Xylariaceae sp. AK1471]|nr:ankyrin repeat-containing domain protein [Xylariaceae sp. AK1471]